MSTSVSKALRVRQRAELLQRARAFFQQRGLTETDVPILVRRPPADDHIDLFEVPTHQGIRYLHSSPEYGMKRLLAAGCGDLFQISHVFRAGELGRLHAPEFTMAEWYRIGWSLEQLMQEVYELFLHFLPQQPMQIYRYWDLLEHTYGQPMHQLSLPLLRTHAITEGWHPHGSSTMTELIQFLFQSRVEPQLGRGEVSFVVDWPDDQAALARLHTAPEGLVAQRFEAYVEGVELANGYDELVDPLEQRARLEQANQLRRDRGLAPYPPDEALLTMLHQLPPCSGVAVGLDRLFMLSLQAATLAEILPWCWHTS